MRLGPRIYHALLERHDGVTVRLAGGSYNKVGGDRRGVPHDIAHLLIEEALGLRGGLWGVLACGGLVQNASEVAGRRKPHAAERARAISRAASRTLWEAEVVVRAAADLVLAGEALTDAAMQDACGARYWAEGAIDDTVRSELPAALRAAAVAWWRLGEGEPYRLSWRLPPPR